MVTPLNLADLPPIYEGWVRDIASRFEHKLRERKITHNIEGGDEFEVALCEQLREILPTGVGVCRGYIVDAFGGKAGDDVIVYDAARVPTLRGLGGDLHKLDYVPAEAVYAYVEAKQTLYIEPTKKQAGQSLAKACEQVAAVKALLRHGTARYDMSPRVRKQFKITKPGGWPERGNPWYASILTTKIVLAKKKSLSSRNVDVADTGKIIQILDDDPRKRADVIASPHIFMAPVFCEGEPVVSDLRPFMTEDTNISVSSSDGISLGLALVHLLWAVGEIRLGNALWTSAMHQEMNSQRMAGALAALYSATPLPPDAAAEQVAREKKEEEEAEARRKNPW